MNLRKYLGKHLKEIGIKKFDNETSHFLKACKKFEVENFEENDLLMLKSILEHGLKRSYQEAVNDYFYKKYKDSEIWKKLLEITENENFEFADNFRISDGSPIDEIVYYLVQFYGCCGFYDEKITIDEIEYKIGFNYGH